VDVDDAALLEVTHTLLLGPGRRAFAQGKAQEYDTSYFRHQMPGGCWEDAADSSRR